MKGNARNKPCPSMRATDPNTGRAGRIGGGVSMPASIGLLLELHGQFQLISPWQLVIGPEPFEPVRGRPWWRCSTLAPDRVAGRAARAPRADRGRRPQPMPPRSHGSQVTHRRASSASPSPAGRSAVATRRLTQSSSSTTFPHWIIHRDELHRRPWRPSDGSVVPAGVGSDPMARSHLANHHAVAQALGPVVREALALVHGAGAVVEERRVLLPDAAGVVRVALTTPPPACAISSTAPRSATAARP